MAEMVQTVQPDVAVVTNVGYGKTDSFAGLDEIAAENRLLLDRLGAAPPSGPQRVVEVTQAVTVADGRFRFTRDYEGLEVIPKAGTVIAYDGSEPIRTPYDGCVLIMPSRRLARGFTAVRLGRFVA